MINYSPVGDLITVAICFVMIVLILFSFIRFTRSFKLFLSIIGLLILAGLTNVAFHQIIFSARLPLYGLAYALHSLFHAFLYGIFVLFALYITEAAKLTRRKKTPFLIASGAIFVIYVTLDIVLTLTGNMVHLEKNVSFFSPHHIFIYGYITFVILLIILLIVAGKQVYKRLMLGFYGTIGVSFVLLIVQSIYEQSSFTVATFLFPVLAMFYSLHSNPYDAKSGAVDSIAFEDTIRYYYEHNKDFVFMSLYLKTIGDAGLEMPPEVLATIRKVTDTLFHKAQVFRADHGHEIMLFLKENNPHYEEAIQSVEDLFPDEYQKFQFDYQLITGFSDDEISRKNDYLNFIRSIHQRIPLNTFHRVIPEDVDSYNRTEYILQELEDICRKKDLNDPRVLVYCQPIYNIQTGSYDTAEALMRLNLDQTGILPPDQFIALAEQHEYIHMLTEIILFKTCEAIRHMTDEGFHISRISVNVSVIDLKEKNFCEDISRIIDQSGIEKNRIALELTETQNENDFIMMKDRIRKLRDSGVIFYLDDFGTGYSNMERIMELPFDIIKFDRSLVLASCSNKRARQVVICLASLFSTMDYHVLYEGVENEQQEKICLDMSASYLQGYKYARPVPIRDLRNYFINNNQE